MYIFVFLPNIWSFDKTFPLILGWIIPLSTVKSKKYIYKGQVNNNEEKIIGEEKAENEKKKKWAWEKQVGKE